MKAQRIAKYLVKALARKSDPERWSQLANHDESWSPRAEKVAAMAAVGEKVVEFGAGRCHLRDYLAEGVGYQPADIVEREPGCFVIDLNETPYPDLPAGDVAVFNGVIEYVYDVGELVDHLAKSYSAVVVTYADVGEGSRKRLKRLKNGWVNSFTRRKLLGIFVDRGFHLEQEERWERQGIYRFSREK
jgi:hypothetical protein